ncbi:VWA domain-containing protein [uncultured Neptuniibacter sp.]|uniref:nitric oxide reductase activation protein NorD n=1 Tax=uncultured Neptuniibacter sp. TaxID=502143 RepID=UPI002610177C|nr:VWA domain-containing protein [uncultured Neptuniibacter sp.]
MEEQVGQFWDRFITKLADPNHQHEPVKLQELRKPLAIFFRTLGGEPGLSIRAASETSNDSKRSWIQRLAGSHQRIALAWRDEDTLCLPESLNVYPQASLNRDLYYWLAALACAPSYTDSSWIKRSQQQTNWVLSKFPGLKQRYTCLLEALIPLRAKHLKGMDAKIEQVILQALRNPGSVESLPQSKLNPAPVPLWLHPSPPLSQPVATTAHSTDDGRSNSSGESEESKQQKKRQAEPTEMPEEKGGLLALRYETSLFSLAEMTRVNRETEEEDDLSSADANADDLEKLSIARDNQTIAKRIRFDLDLAPEADDDIDLSGPLLLPEWDHRKQELIPDYCQIISPKADDSSSAELPHHLQYSAKRLRRQFQSLRPHCQWIKQQPEGSELDLEAYSHFHSQRAAGHLVAEPNLYSALQRNHRDLACLLLADLSLSTDAWVAQQARVIDIIRDSLMLFGETLQQTGDRFAIYGFSSRFRNHVRFHTLKSFEQPYGGKVRGQINAIKPGYYTRMGTAVRRATQLLSEQPNQQKLLLLLTDGKPNDLDKYEGRYGIEDTREAIREARKAGLIPFCITIDNEGEDYLPYLFGRNHYTLVRRATELPGKLPQLYARLTSLPH